MVAGVSPASGICYGGHGDLPDFQLLILIIILILIEFCSRVAHNKPALSLSNGSRVLAKMPVRLGPSDLRELCACSGGL